MIIIEINKYKIIIEYDKFKKKLFLFFSVLLKIDQSEPIKI